MPRLPEFPQTPKMENFARVVNGFVYPSVVNPSVMVRFGVRVSVGVQFSAWAIVLEPLMI